jgi:signal transduction histidine kinase
MSSISNVIALPLRDEYDERGSLERDVVFALATADDLASGMKHVLERIRRDSLAARVEWWAAGDDGALDLFVAVGTARGGRETLRLGRAGVLVLHDGRVDQEIESAMGSLTPILRRRAAEERLARTTIQLAQHNEALEDFAALVAHELKTPLQAALVADEPSRSIEDALLLVDALLEASQSQSGDRRFASVADCLDQAIADLRAEVEITTDLSTTLPLPPAPLRTILRNLLSNAVAAGAGRVHVTAARSSGSCRVVVDDEGVGLSAIDRYAGGSGLGLSLCRRIAARFGGVLELEARPTGGTRATLEFAEAA